MGPDEGAGLAVRRVAANLLDRALSEGVPVETMLRWAQAPLTEPDRGLLAHLLYGSLRWLRRLDWIVTRAADRPLQEIDVELLAPLRLAVYQLLWLERIPPHAAVDTAVELARRRNRRAAGFVNAVLRRVARTPTPDAWPVEVEDPVERLAVETSHLTVLVRRWWERFGEATVRSMLAASNREKPMHLVAFEDRGGRTALATALASEGVETVGSSLSELGLIVRAGDPLATTAFRNGEFYVADEGAQAAALLPPPRPGESVADLAAAPGGKSFALLAAEPTLSIVAMDRDLGRLGVMAQNCRRLGRTIPMVVGDAGRPPLAGGYDRVIVDLPCSGTGTLRKHPELKWRFSLEALEGLAHRAQRLALGAAALVRPGGVLSLITCSLEPEENEEVAALVRSEHQELAPLAPTGANHDDLLVDPDHGRWRLFPGGDHDGFTVHLLRRR